MKNFFEYVEYGKIHYPSDSSDFAILDYSSEEAKMAAGPLCGQFSAWLNFPEAYRTSFLDKVGSLSAALVPVPQTERFLFCQLQCRDEGEYARFTGNVPRVSRPYAQIRYVLIDTDKKEILTEAFQRGEMPYSSFFETHPRHRDWAEELYALKNYTAPGSRYPLHVEFERATKQDDVLKQKADQIVGFLLNYPRRDASQPGENTNRWKARIVDSELISIEKLQVLELVQFKLWILTGLFTFALDYISDVSDLFIKFYPEEQGEYKDNRPILQLEASSVELPDSVQVLNRYLEVVRIFAASDPQRCDQLVDLVARLFKFNFSLPESVWLAMQCTGMDGFMEVKLSGGAETVDKHLLLSAVWEFHKNDAEKLLSTLSCLVEKKIISSELIISFLIDKDLNEKEHAEADILSLVCQQIKLNNIDISGSIVRSKFEHYLDTLTDRRKFFLLKELSKNELIEAKKDNFDFVLVRLSEDKRMEFLQTLLGKNDDDDKHLFYHLARSRGLTDDFLDKNWDAVSKYAIQDAKFLDWFFDNLLVKDFQKAVHFHKAYLQSRSSWENRHKNPLLDLQSPVPEALFVFYQQLPNDEDREYKFWQIVNNFSSSAVQLFQETWIDFLVQKYKKEGDTTAFQILKFRVIDADYMFPYKEKGYFIVSRIPLDLILELRLVSFCVDKKEFDVLPDVFIRKYTEEFPKGFTKEDFRKYSDDLGGYIKKISSQQKRQFSFLYFYLVNIQFFVGTVVGNETNWSNFFKRHEVVFSRDEYQLIFRLCSLCSSRNISVDKVQEIVENFSGDKQQILKKFLHKKKVKNISFVSGQKNLLETTSVSKKFGLRFAVLSVGVISFALFIFLLFWAFWVIGHWLLAAITLAFLIVSMAAFAIYVLMLQG